MVRDEIEISEESAYNEKTPSLKEICLRHISKISNICCQELTGGYWQEKPMKIGGGMVITKTYHPDLREAYCNAVDFLFDIVYPYSDSNFKKVFASDYTGEQEDIKQKLKDKRMLFKQICIMFERTNFFAGTEGTDE